MTEFKIIISPELQLLANAQGWDLKSLVEEGVTDKLIMWFKRGDETTEYNIKRWVKIEEVKKE